MKREQEKTGKSTDHTLPPEVSPTIPAELSSAIEAMKETHQKEEVITRQQWEEKKELKEKQEKTKFKGFSQKLAQGEGPNPLLKKSKPIGGVRGKFHPSKKGKT